MEKASYDQERKVQQGNFKKALETITSIMTGSIEEVDTRLNLDTESTAIRITTEANEDFISQVSTEVDSVTVASSDSEAVIESIIESIIDSINVDKDKDPRI